MLGARQLRNSRSCIHEGLRHPPLMPFARLRCLRSSSSLLSYSMYLWDCRWTCHRFQQPE